MYSMTSIGFVGMVRSQSGFFDDNNWAPADFCYKSIRSASGTPKDWVTCCSSHPVSINCSSKIYRPHNKCFLNITNDFNDIYNSDSMWYNCCKAVCKSVATCQNTIYCDTNFPQPYEYVVLLTLFSVIGILGILGIVVVGIVLVKRKRDAHREQKNATQSIYYELEKGSSTKWSESGGSTKWSSSTKWSPMEDLPSFSDPEISRRSHTLRLTEGPDPDSRQVEVVSSKETPHVYSKYRRRRRPVTETSSSEEYPVELRAVQHLTGRGGPASIYTSEETIQSYPSRPVIEVYPSNSEFTRSRSIGGCQSKLDISRFEWYPKQIIAKGYHNRTSEEFTISGGRYRSKSTLEVHSRRHSTDVHRGYPVPVELSKRDRRQSYEPYYYRDRQTDNDHDQYPDRYPSRNRPASQEKNRSLSRDRENSRNRSASGDRYVYIDRYSSRERDQYPNCLDARLVRPRNGKLPVNTRAVVSPHTERTNSGRSKKSTNVVVSDRRRRHRMDQAGRCRLESQSRPARKEKMSGNRCSGRDKAVRTKLNNVQRYPSKDVYENIPIPKVTWQRSRSTAANRHDKTTIGTYRSAYETYKSGKSGDSFRSAIDTHRASQDPPASNPKIPIDKQVGEFNNEAQTPHPQEYKYFNVSEHQGGRVLGSLAAMVHGAHGVAK